MANGKLLADQIEHSSAGAVDTQFVVKGSTKAYIDIPSGQASISKSLNVSTLTDSGTGDGVVNYTNNFDGAFYAIASACNDYASVTSIMYAHDITEGTQAASNYHFETVWWNASNHRTNGDIRSRSILVGDLA